MSPRSRVMFLVVVCIAGTAAVISTYRLGSWLYAHRRGNLLSWSTDGPVPDTLPELRNPNHLMGSRAVQELLLRIRERPQPQAFVDAALSGSGITAANVVAAGILRVSADRYALAFPLLTTPDLGTLLEITSRHAENLVDVLLRRRQDIERALRVYPASSVPPGSIAFFALGCMSLDWDGLKLTEELRYRVPFKKDGVGRVHWATVRGSTTSPRGMYWGSHSDYSPVHLTTFGDHFSRATRAGFPDLAWAMARPTQTALIPENVRPDLTRLARQADIRTLAVRVGELMMTLRAAPLAVGDLAARAGLPEAEVGDTVALLIRLQYVRRVDGRCAILVPVFSPADRQMVQILREIGRETMTSWLAEHYRALEADLARVTPVGVALPFEETFYYVWHYLFGTANRLLVTRGLFADPYGADRTYPGFIPAVWHEGAYDGN